MQPKTEPARIFLSAAFTCALATVLTTPLLAQESETPPESSSQPGQDSPFVLELGLLAGAHFFADDLELGVPDAPGLVSSPENGTEFGLRLGVVWQSWLSAEIEAASIPTKDRMDGIGAIITSYKAHGLVHFLKGRLRPFALLGGGLMQVASTNGVRGVGNILGQGIQFRDIDPEFHAGVGVKYLVDDRIVVRIDARAMMLPDYHGPGHTFDWETLLGVSYSFGAGGTPSPVDAPAQPEEAPAPELQAEPVPEAVPDPAVEPVPQSEPEVPPEPQVQAMAPIPMPQAPVTPAPPQAPAVVAPPSKAGDADHDQVLDDVDRCPDQPEDRDAFADFDGCPEFDNDQDDTLDSADRCPYEAETRNGYLDDDACPDELPPELQLLIGSTDGVSFAAKSAQIQTDAFVVLGSLVQALNKYPEIRILVEGHASGEGDAKRELALAQARGDAARAFLIALGIRPNRIEVQAFASDRPIAPNIGPRARDRNRRVVFKLLPPLAPVQP